MLDTQENAGAHKAYAAPSPNSCGELRAWYELRPRGARQKPRAAAGVQRTILLLSMYVLH